MPKKYPSNEGPPIELILLREAMLRGENTWDNSFFRDMVEKRPHYPSKVYDKLSVVELKGVINQHNASDKCPVTGRNALHMSVLSLRSEQARRFNLCMSNGTDVNAQYSPQCESYQNTPLHLLLVNENWLGSRLFIEYSRRYKRVIDYNIEDTQGKTVLLLACKMGSDKFIDLILGQKVSGAEVNVNQPDEEGNTPLHYVCALGRLASVQRLLDMGADLNACDKRSRKPIDMLDLPEEQVKEILNSVSIEPNRDANADYNYFHNTDYQPLYNMTFNSENREKLKSQLNPTLAGGVLLSEKEKNCIESQLQTLSGKSFISACLEARPAVKAFIGQYRVGSSVSPNEKTGLYTASSSC